MTYIVQVMPAEDLDLSLTEWVVLSLLAEGPSHGFALARALTRGTTLGQVWTVPRPLVYRALGRLEGQALATPAGEEPGEPGPPRTIYKITPRGRRAVTRWRREPVTHLREVRTTFLTKALLTQRAGEPLAHLVEAQRDIFAPLFRSLGDLIEENDDELIVAAWRYESSQAIARLLDRLATTAS